MSDKTAGQVVFYELPPQRVRAVRRVLDELGVLTGELSPPGDDPVIVLGQVYGDVQIPCGWVDDEEVVHRLHEVAPDAVFKVWEDPAHQWLGQAATYAPALGAFAYDCDSNGRFVFTVEELGTPAAAAGTAWWVLEQRRREELGRFPTSCNLVVSEVLPAAGLLCDDCSEDLAGQPPVCCDACARAVDHLGVCAHAGHDHTPCAACGQVDARLTRWAGDGAEGSDPCYSYGRCPACAWGQRGGSVCPNTGEGARATPHPERGEADREDVPRAVINAAAKTTVPTIAAVTDGELPCIEFGGVCVFVYLHTDGALRVALHLEGADPHVWPAVDADPSCMPVTLDVGGALVWAADDAGVERCSHERQATLPRGPRPGTALLCAALAAGIAWTVLGWFPLALAVAVLVVASRVQPPSDAETVRTDGELHPLPAWPRCCAASAPGRSPRARRPMRWRPPTPTRWPSGIRPTPTRRARPRRGPRWR